MNKIDIVDRIWPIIGDKLPQGPYPTDVSELKNRNFIEAIVWLSETDGDWDGLPVRYGGKEAVYQKFNRWTRNGVWERVFSALHEQEEMTLAFDGRRITLDLDNPKSGLRLTRRIHRRSARK